MGFFGRSESKDTPKPQAEDRSIQLLPTDTMHDRLEKALRYGGLVNPNRLGLVDMMTFIMTEYERLYGPCWPTPPSDRRKTEGTSTTEQSS